MVVSIRSTEPCLSYILTEFARAACLTRTPSTRRLKSVVTSPWKFGESFLPRNRSTSGLCMSATAYRTSEGYNEASAS